MIREYKNRPVDVVVCRNTNFAVEVHTWRGDDNHWHKTDLPTNPHQLYAAYAKEFGEELPF